MAARPPLLNQLSLPDAQRSSDCGETATAMLLEAGGFPDTPEEEISDLNHSGVTSTPELSGLLVANGATVTPVPAADFPTLLAAGDAYALVLIHDDNNANPSPSGPFRHYIAAYAIASSGAVKCVNPWGGRDMAYDRATLVASTIWVAVVRFPATPVDNPTPVHTGTPTSAVTEEPPMNLRFVDSWNGSQHMLSLGADGNLIHHWYGGAAGWLKEAALASGLVPSGHIEITQDAGQLRVGSLRADGRIFRTTQLANKGTWTPEEIA